MEGQVAVDGRPLAVADVVELLSALSTASDSAEIAAALGEHAAPPVRTAAMDVFNILAHLRRREKELTGLYATARELTGVRTIDEVLQAIAERAQELIPSADASFISVLQDDGGFKVRAGVGLTSHAFKQVHTVPGSGMAGRIAETGTMLWTRHYGDSEDIEHDPVVDSALAEDGLVSVLGVPLKIRDKVIGVLYASNRFERPLSAEESALIMAFADQAAIALENARLFSELDLARCVAEEGAHSFQRAARLHDQLTRLVLEGGTVEQVAEALASVAKSPVHVLDTDGTVIATEADREAPATVLPDLDPATEESRRSGHCVAVQIATDEWLHVAALGTRESRFGALVLESTTTLDEPDRRNLERTAHIVSLLFFRRQAIVEAEERVHGELFKELVTGGALTEQQQLLAQARGIDLTQPHVCVAVNRTTGRPLDLRWAVTSLARTLGGLGGEHGGGAAALVPADSAQAVAAGVHEALARDIGAGLVICAGRPVLPLSGDLGDQMRRAARCAGLVRALGRDDAAVTTEELGLYSLLFDTDRAEDLSNFLDATLGPLLTYDTTKHGALIKTVKAYFEHDTNVARTARALYVHTNTVIKRLSRVENLLGADWHASERGLQLRMAVQLHALAQPATDR